jgi:hypothetical protein
VFFSRFLREKFTHRPLFKAKQAENKGNMGLFSDLQADGTVHAKEIANRVNTDRNSK